MAALLLILVSTQDWRDLAHELLLKAKEMQPPEIDTKIELLKKAIDAQISKNTNEQNV